MGIQADTMGSVEARATRRVESCIVKMCWFGECVGFGRVGKQRQGYLESRVLEYVECGRGVLLYKACTKCKTVG